MSKKNTKTLFVGVDFTPSSENAVKYAAMLAKKGKMSVTLFHVFDLPVINTYSGAMFISYDELKLSFQDKLNKYAENVKKLYPGTEIRTIVASGSVKNEIETLSRKKNIFCIVMGLETKTKLSKFIYGTSSMDIAGRINCPLIIVPQAYKKHKLLSAAMGVDNQGHFTKSLLTKVNALKAALGIKLKYVHVRTPEEIFQSKKSRTLVAAEQIEATDFASGMTRFTRKNRCDLALIISHSHSQFYRFFRETNTKTLAFQSKIPVLSIHN